MENFGFSGWLTFLFSRMENFARSFIQLLNELILEQVYEEQLVLYHSVQYQN